MKKLLHAALLGTFSAIILAFGGCEAGLTGSNDNDSSEDFSFSEMYNKIDSLQTQIDTLEKLSDIDYVKTTLTGLQSDIATLQTTVAAQASTITTLETELNTLKTTFTGVTRDGSNTIIFSGVNVQINNGTGTTNGAVNALGNLIIGYNELRTDTYGLTYGADDRSGSHNLILGRHQNYPSFSGIILGSLNTAGAEGNFVAGHGNNASGRYASITGGRSNIAGSGPYSTVSGGIGRTASGDGDWAAGSYWLDD